MTDPVPSKECDCCKDGFFPFCPCGCHQRVAAQRIAHAVSMEEQVEHLRRENVRWENAHKILLSEIERLKVQKDNLLDAVNAKQAKIDALMLEFCPGKMSAEQRAEWATHQQPLRALVESAYKDGYGGDLTDDRDLSARTLEMMRRMSGESAAERALRNCLLLAMSRLHRRSVSGVEKLDWEHILRFCKEGGVEPSPLRAAPPPGDDPADVIMSRGDGG